MDGLKTICWWLCVTDICLDNAVVQFIFISRGNTNYHMKNDNMSDNDSNDRIMTHL